MALKLNRITFQSQKLPSFALPPMAGLRSPKFFMASTLRFGSKSCDIILVDAFSWLAVYGYIVEEISIEKWSINY
ncbi:hypothetical protein V6Z11_D03G086100 [Gossypium hirsutum]